MEFLKRDIAFVHQVEGTGFNGNLVHDLGIVDFSRCEQNEGGNGAPQVHQSMHLERALPVVELGPRAQFQTQLDSGAVERIDHFFKTNPQLFILLKRRGFLDQSHRKVLIDTPILLLVGLRKRRSWHRLDAGSVEVSAEVKCSLNVTQASPVGELSKAHHHELVTAIEPDGMAIAFVAVDTLLELIFVDERHNLREDCFSLVHGLRTAA